MVWTHGPALAPRPVLEALPAFTPTSDPLFRLDWGSCTPQTLALGSWHHPEQSRALHSMKWELSKEREGRMLRSLQREAPGLWTTLLPSVSISPHLAPHLGEHEGEGDQEGILVS